MESVGRKRIAFNTDIVAWANQQAGFLRAGLLSEVDLEHVAGRLFIRVKNKATAAVKGIAKAPKGKRLSIDEMKPFAAKARKFAYASDEAGQELGALADAAKGAAHRAGTAIDDAMVSIAASNKRIAGVEAAAAKSSRAPLHQSFQPVKSQI